ncbi:hypothetical protein NKH61_05415 [Mesorhizobium sp. M1005]|uniref:hypothetical protein n=1 Tax=unclassified Mesorhizobium TaxID=325217 RepID=UPI00333843EF
MTDRPILFSAPMVRALLAGTKTQTRRVLRAMPGMTIADATVDAGPAIGGIGRRLELPVDKLKVPYAVRDRLYVREAHHRTNDSMDSHLVGYDFADDSSHRGAYIRDVEAVGKVEFFRHSLGGWGGRTSRNYPAMHMPRWASRLTLAVADVRVQRLQDISEEDAKAEGMSGEFCDYELYGQSKPYRYEFSGLWNSLNADRGFGWDVNPWVVAVSFAVDQRNIDEPR